MKLLLIEDNSKLNASIIVELEKEGFICEAVFTYHEAAEKIALYLYDILVVDINLPDGSGLELIRCIKKHQVNAGIIVISARNSLDNKIEGLELGADDYLTKPFDNAELIARIKSLLRRRKFDGSNKLFFNALEIDTDERSVIANKVLISLTKSEYDILLFLIVNANRVLTKESIAEHIYGDNMDLADSFDFIYSHIKNLRKKLVDTGCDNYIKAVYGIGYKITKVG